MVSLALILGFMFFMAFGVPVSMALGLAALLALLVSGNTGFLFVIPQQMVEGVDHPSLVAIPFFLLAGCYPQTIRYCRNRSAKSSISRVVVSCWIWRDTAWRKRLRSMQFPSFS